MASDKQIINRELDFQRNLSRAKDTEPMAATIINLGQINTRNLFIAHLELSHSYSRYTTRLFALKEPPNVTINVFEHHIICCNGVFEALYL